MENDKCRSKAMKIAAASQGACMPLFFCIITVCDLIQNVKGSFFFFSFITVGVHSVALEGEDRDQVVVTGDAIDSVCLTNKFRKKFNYATLMSVTEAKASNDGDAGGEHKDETTAENFPITYCYSNFPPPTHLYVMDYDPYPNGCSIL